MTLTEKSWVKVTIALAVPMILGLAFVYGQIYFLNKQGGVMSFTPTAVNSANSAKLMNSTNKELVLILKEKRFIVSPQELKTWIERYDRSYTGTGKQEYRINQQKITSYLEGISKEINTAPIEARFSISNDKITEFSAPQKGRLLNIPESRANIISVLTQNTNSLPDVSTGGNEAELVIDEIEPKLTLDKVNNLGINTLLGRGESNFAGSSNSRIHNIGVGSKIFNGILLKPGQEFSFNQSLGPVDASGGYLPELVIKSGKLIPEYGGGLCQVSTTVFRATIAAGLAILERHPHSLPVRYYNPQGFDATIYPNISDFKFKNDTPTYIFIQSNISGSKIYFEIYGTSDGRKVTIDGPRQYDIKSDGSLKAVLSRTIIYADGTEKKDVFYSSYSSPSAFQIIKNPLE